MSTLTEVPVLVHTGSSTLSLAPYKVKVHYSLTIFPLYNISRICFLTRERITPLCNSKRFSVNHPKPGREDRLPNYFTESARNLAMLNYTLNHR